MRRISRDTAHVLIISTFNAVFRYSLSFSLSLLSGYEEAVIYTRGIIYGIDGFDLSKGNAHNWTGQAVYPILKNTRFHKFSRYPDALSLYVCVCVCDDLYNGEINVTKDQSE